MKLVALFSCGMLFSKSVLYMENYVHIIEVIQGQSRVLKKLQNDMYCRKCMVEFVNETQHFTINMDTLSEEI